MQKTLLQHRAFLALVAGAATTGGESAAIQSDAAVDPAATVPQADYDIQDIVVTAERRLQKLQEVPITITALNAAQLESQGVTNAFDVAKITPSLTTGRQVGFGTPFIRGIGSSVQIGDEVSVASYVDNFYQGTSITSQLPFNNIERVDEGAAGHALWT